MRSGSSQSDTPSTKCGDNNQNDRAGSNWWIHWTESLERRGEELLVQDKTPAIQARASCRASGACANRPQRKFSKCWQPPKRLGSIRVPACGVLAEQSFPAGRRKLHAGKCALPGPALGSVHEFRGVLFERELIYAWDGDKISSCNDQRSCLGAAQGSVRRGQAFACGSTCRNE